MVLWIASYPRSGNTFARLSLRRSFGILSTSVYPAEMDTPGPVNSFLAGLIRGEFEVTPEHSFIKTHELPGSDGHAAIYLVRHAGDALLSYAHFILQTQHGIPPGGDRELLLETLRELIVNPGYFGGWGAHVLAWTRRTAPTCVVRFEDLILNPTEELRRALHTLGHTRFSPNESKLPPFEELHEVLPLSFRQGRIGSWKTEMPQPLQMLLRELHHEALEMYGYE